MTPDRPPIRYRCILCRKPAHKGVICFPCLEDLRRRPWDHGAYLCVSAAGLLAHPFSRPMENDS